MCQGHLSHEEGRVNVPNHDKCEHVMVFWVGFFGCWWFGFFVCFGFIWGFFFGFFLGFLTRFRGFLIIFGFVF